jgi:hypothetical protein
MSYQNQRSTTYSWAFFNFLYAIIWLIVLIAGFSFKHQLANFIVTTNVDENIVGAIWFSMLAGGIGGVTGILYSLYWHAIVVKDFSKAFVIYYLVQPVIGLVLGATVSLIIGFGFLVVNVAMPNPSDFQEILLSPTIVAIQIVVSWMVGFRQRVILAMIKKRFSPKKVKS